MEMLFTHSDLDGAACGVLFKTIYPQGEITFCPSGAAPEKIRGFLRTGRIPDYLLITDVSIDDATAIDLERLQAQGVKVAMFDHHETSLNVKEYKWATIDTRLCATALYFNSMRASNPKAKEYMEFARLVNIFDNYQVGNKEFDRAHQLNKIMEYHKEKSSLTGFVNRFLTNQDCNPDAMEAPIIEYILYNDRKYIEAAARRAVILPSPYGVARAIVAASRCINDVAQRIMTNHQEVGFVEIVDLERESVSVRSRGKFNASQYAEARGGGGHKEAAGYRFPFDMITSFMEQK
ncbi:MAG: hypothetical protein ACM3PA_01140 [Methanomassiliicoccales archaeon]